MVSGLQVMFSSVLHKKLPAESGINVVCVSPGIVHTNVVSFYLRKYQPIGSRNKTLEYIIFNFICIILYIP